jgi:hypothetical protein
MALRIFPLSCQDYEYKHISEVCHVTHNLVITVYMNYISSGIFLKSPGIPGDKAPESSKENSGE